jgi:hypothetical protein
MRERIQMLLDGKIPLNDSHGSYFVNTALPNITLRVLRNRYTSSPNKHNQKTFESNFLTWISSSYMDEELILKAQGFIKRVVDVIIVLPPKHFPMLIERLIHIFNPDQVFYYQRLIPFGSKLRLEEPFARLPVHFPFSSHLHTFIELINFHWKNVECH